MTTRWGRLKLNYVLVRRVRGRAGQEGSRRAVGIGTAWKDRARSAKVEQKESQVPVDLWTVSMPPGDRMNM
jgi:hypothetical protein